MKIGRFSASTKGELKVLSKVQVLQFKCSGLGSSTIDDLMDSVLHVWNDIGTIIPPMKLRDLVVLNGDEYPVQVSLQSAAGGGTFTVVMDVELSETGYLNPVIYVELDNQVALAVDLSAEAPVKSTAVQIRKYNTMAIMAPKMLPKNSICVIPLSNLSTLQVDENVMSESEILTHSNRLLSDGCMREVHPVLWDYAKTTPAIIENCVYTEIMKNYAMGYGSLSSGCVVIYTGEHSFMLYPNGTATITYCSKEKTVIAQQVETALAVSGNSGNVDTNEFAAAVAAVGKEAERQNMTTEQTQFLANQVVKCLPSAIIAKGFGVKDFNLASESGTLSGNSKFVGR